MPKIMFKDILEYFPDAEKPKKDFTIIDMDKVEDDRLSSIVYEFARINNEDRDLYRRILLEKVSIMIDGDIKHPDVWSYLRVDENTEIIITPALEGIVVGFVGGMGVAALGGAAVSYAGGMVAGGTLLGMSAATLTTIGMGLILTGIGMALTALVQAIFAPDMPSLPGTDQQQTKTYSWSGIRSQARVGVPVPILIGTHKVGGYILTLYTKSIKNENYFYALFAMSEGVVDGLCRADDVLSVCTTSNRASSDYRDPAIYINDQLERNFEGVNWWFRNGENEQNDVKDVFDPTAQNIIPNFNDVRVQYDDGRELISEDDGGLLYTTHAPVDRIEVQTTSNGLYSVDRITGSLSDVSIEYKIEYKRAADPDLPQYWTIYHPAVSTATCLCRYAVVDMATLAVSCINNYDVYASADYGVCSTYYPDWWEAWDNRPCGYRTTVPAKYQIQPHFAGATFWNGKVIFFGANRPNFVRIRCNKAWWVNTWTMAFEWEVWENGNIRYVNSEGTRWQK
jgi:predicted phage tail protein